MLKDTPAASKILKYLLKFLIILKLSRLLNDKAKSMVVYTIFV